MRLRYQVRSPRVAVGIKAGNAAAFHPPIEFLLTLLALQHHLVVVTQHANKFTASLQSNQFFDHAARIETAIYVVSQRNNDVLRLRIDRFNQGFESYRTSVDIANCDGATGLSFRNFHRLPLTHGTDHFLRSSLLFHVQFTWCEFDCL